MDFGQSHLGSHTIPAGWLCESFSLAGIASNPAAQAAADKPGIVQVVLFVFDVSFSLVNGPPLNKPIRRISGKTWALARPWLRKLAIVDDRRFGQA
jgi:hypothetical protein